MQSLSSKSGGEAAAAADGRAAAAGAGSTAAKVDEEVVSNFDIKRIRRFEGNIRAAGNFNRFR